MTLENFFLEIIEIEQLKNIGEKGLDECINDIDAFINTIKFNEKVAAALIS